MTDKRLDKDNPDVMFKYKNKSNKREQKKFVLSNEIYKPITDQRITRVTSSRDLKLEKDTPDNDLLLKVENKFQERQNELSTIKKPKRRMRSVYGRRRRKKKEDKKHAELKEESKKSNTEEKGDEYGKIVNDLKGLGILK